MRHSAPNQGAKLFIYTCSKTSLGSVWVLKNQGKRKKAGGNNKYFCLFVIIMGSRTINEVKKKIGRKLCTLKITILCKEKLEKH